MSESKNITKVHPNHAYKNDEDCNKPNVQYIFSLLTGDRPLITRSMLATVNDDQYVIGPMREVLINDDQFLNWFNSPDIIEKRNILRGNNNRDPDIGLRNKCFFIYIPAQEDDFNVYKIIIIRLIKYYFYKFIFLYIDIYMQKLSHSNVSFEVALKNMYELFFNDVTPEYINQYELVLVDTLEKLLDECINEFLKQVKPDKSFDITVVITTIEEQLLPNIWLYIQHHIDLQTTLPDITASYMEMNKKIVEKYDWQNIDTYKNIEVASFLSRKIEYLNNCKFILKYIYRVLNNGPIKINFMIDDLLKLFKIGRAHV